MSMIPLAGGAAAAMGGGNFFKAVFDRSRVGSLFKGMEQSEIEQQLTMARIQGLQEDLKLSQLQRQEYEATSGYREMKRKLDLDIDQSSLSSNRAREGTETLQQALIQAQLAARKTESAESAEDRPLKKRALAADTKRAEHEAGKAGADELVGQLSAMKGLSGALSHLPTTADILPFIKMVNPNAREVEIAALTPVFAGMLEESKKTLADNQRVVSDGRAKDQAAAFQANMAGAGLKASVISSISDFVSRAPDPAAAIAAIDAGWPGEEGEPMRAAARAATAKFSSPADKEYADQIGKQLGVLMGSKLALEDAVTQESDSTWTSTKTFRANKRKELDRVNAQITKLEAQLKAGLSKRSAAEPSAGPVGIAKTDEDLPLITTAAEHAALPSGTRYRTKNGVGTKR